MKTAKHSRDRVTSWQEELVRITPELPSLPKAARDLVLELVAQFAVEDGEHERDVEAVVVPLHAVAA